MMPIASYAGLTPGRANDRPVGGCQATNLGTKHVVLLRFVGMIHDFDGIYFFLKG